MCKKKLIINIQSFIVIIVEILGFCATGILAALTASEWLEVAKEFPSDRETLKSLGQHIAGAAVWINIVILIALSLN